jgi:hypothetical protein
MRSVSIIITKFLFLPEKYSIEEMPHWQLLRHAWLSCSLNTAVQAHDCSNSVGDFNDC